jgi:hypothetical protein
MTRETISCLCEDRTDFSSAPGEVAHDLNHADEDTMNRSSIMAAFIVLLLANLFAHPAQAYRSKHHHSAAASVGACVLTNEGRRICGPAAAQRGYVVDANGNRATRVSDNGTIIGGRPSGCPHAYCGCGLRKYLGLADKRLNLASNWARLFPHVGGPGPGIAAVRSGHVMYIERAAGNGQWLVRDYNSGGGLSRLHVRSVRGYTFVNPRAMLAKN